MVFKYVEPGSLRPLRTVLAVFTTYGSSITKTDLYPRSTAVKFGYMLVSFVVLVQIYANLLALVR